MPNGAIRVNRSATHPRKSAASRSRSLGQAAGSSSTTRYASIIPVRKPSALPQR